MQHLSTTLIGITTALLVSCGTANAQSLTPINLWHTDTVWAGQGMCAAHFTLDGGGGLTIPIEQVQLKLQAINPHQQIVETFTLTIEAFNESNADRYEHALWESELACDDSLHLVVTEAYARVNQQNYDLLAQQALQVNEMTRLALSLAPTQAPTNACNYPKFKQPAVIQDQDGYSNIRAQPNAQSQVIEKLFEQEHFYTFQQKGNWWQICTPTGQVGYLYHNRIRLK